MEQVKNSDSVNLVIQASNGEKKLIKIMHHSNGTPLTQDKVKAIVQEYMNNNGGGTIDTFQTKFASSISDAAVTTNSSSAGSTSASTSAKTTTMAYQTTAQPSPAQQHMQPSSQALQNHFGTRSTTTTTTMVGGVGTTLASSSAAGSGQIVVKPMPSAKYANSKQNTSAKMMQSHGSSNIVAAIAASTASSGAVQKKINRRRKTDRVGKGLRHFSMKVCEKVKEKGTTTYNEVADELVEEFCSQEARGQPVDPASYDQKNIRRRVYDALNVLMAMNIISKDKKEIRWIGLPTNSAQQCSSLERENKLRRERIVAKQQQLRELILQQVSFKSLVTRNKESEDRGIVPSPSSAIQMPFIIVNTHKKTHVNCCISNDKSEYQFKFNDTFEIHDDIEVLKRMGLLLGLDTGDCKYEDIERAKTMVPKAFEKYIELYGRGQEECLPYNDADLFNEDSIIMKTEQMSDEEEELDDDHFSDMSDME